MYWISYFTVPNMAINRNQCTSLPALVPKTTNALQAIHSLVCLNFVNARYI